ncbi:Flagellar hook-associated protein FlgK [Olavius sp. associated proteobacterium Delta 1]|nr:Flagellar hook-associated protein FlgK [Olavius sp. associated proteobacterium Delta 1]
MTDIYGVLSIGSKALLTQQKGIYVTGNNIANVNTPGYTRQRLNMSSDVPVNTSVGPLGTGVTATGVERVYQRFLGVQINNETQTRGNWEAQKDMLGRVEMIFDESGGYGLNQVMSEFWNAWQDLSNNPSGPVERSVLIAKSQIMADSFSKNYQDLQTVRQDIDTMIEGSPAEINLLAENIARLNQKIIQMEAGGNTANDYRDQRDVQLIELSDWIDIDSFENSAGGVTVSVGSGQPLVEGTDAYRLSTRINASGNQNMTWVDADNNAVDITSSINGGKVKGWLDVRDLDIRNYMNRLDTLAQNLMAEVNTLHASGYGLDGSNGNDYFTGAASASGVMDSLLTITAEEGGAGNLSVTVVAGGTAGAETVTTDPITGDIQIAIEDGVSTRTQIAAALQGHSAVASVVATIPGNTPWTLGAGSDSVTLNGGASALNMQVNPAIVLDERLIAAAGSFDSVPGDKPGDNGNSIAIANLKSARILNSNTASFDAYYESIIGDVGYEVQQAGAYYGHQSEMVHQLENYRESISGVSVDEEMVNLVKYQNAYQAAAKLITTADEMMQSVLNMI